MKPEQIRRMLAGIAVGAALILSGLLSLYWVVRNGSFAPELAVEPAEVSYPAPAVELMDLDGRRVTLRDQLGSVVLVNFWATWCSPCRREMPALQRYFDRHAAGGFMVIAINSGERAPEVAAFVEELGLTFPVWLDPESIAMIGSFHAINLPTSFVIDRDGTVRLSWVGGIDLRGLEQYVTPLILE